MTRTWRIEMGFLNRIKVAMGLAPKEEAPIDPVVEAQRQIDEAKVLHHDLEASVASLMAQKRALVSDLAGDREEVEKWSHLAVKAAEIGNEQAVTDAIVRKGEASRSLQAMEQKVSDLQANIDKMGVEESQARLTAAQRELDQMVARGGASDVRERMARILGDDPTSAMSQVKSQVQAKEASADAWDEMTGHDDDMRTSSADDDVKDEVARLMEAAKKQG